MSYDVQHLFLCVFAICKSFLVSCYWARFLISLFVLLLLSFKCSLCIFDDSPLSEMSFANIFCLWLVLLFSFHYLSQSRNFYVQCSPIYPFFVTDYAFDVVSKKSSLNLRSSRFSPKLSSRSYIVLHFAFSSVMYLDFIFVESVRSVSKFILIHVDVHLFQHHLLEGLSLLYHIKDQLTIFMQVYFLSMYSVPLIYLSIHSVTQDCFTILFNVALQYVLKFGSVDPLTLFFFNIVLAMLGLLPLQVVS